MVSDTSRSNVIAINGPNNLCYEDNQGSQLVEQNYSNSDCYRLSKEPTVVALENKANIINFFICYNSQNNYGSQTGQSTYSSNWGHLSNAPIHISTENKAIAINFFQHYNTQNNHGSQSVQNNYNFVQDRSGNVSNHIDPENKTKIINFFDCSNTQNYYGCQTEQNSYNYDWGQLSNKSITIDTKNKAITVNSSNCYNNQDNHGSFGNLDIQNNHNFVRNLSSNAANLIDPENTTTTINFFIYYNTQNNYGCQALQNFYNFDHEFLSNTSEDLVSKEMQEICKYSNLKLKVYLNNSNFVDYRDGNGLNILHWAVNSGQYSTCSAILKKCPQLVNQSDSFGKTPLDYVEGCSDEIIKKDLGKLLTEHKDRK